MDWDMAEKRDLRPMPLVVGLAAGLAAGLAEGAAGWARARFVAGSWRRLMGLTTGVGAGVGLVWRGWDAKSSWSVYREGSCASDSGSLSLCKAGTSGTVVSH
jgi:hypothetical protein